MLSTSYNIHLFKYCDQESIESLFFINNDFNRSIENIPLTLVKYTYNNLEEIISKSYKDNDIIKAVDYICTENNIKKTCNLSHIFIKYDSIELLKYIHEEKSIKFNREEMLWAGYYCNYECLKYLFRLNNNKFLEPTKIFEQIVFKGNIECLKFILENGETFDNKNFKNIIKFEHIECLKIIHNKMIEDNMINVIDIATMCEHASYWGSLECLHFLCTHNYPVYDYCAFVASEKGNMDCLDYLIGNEFCEIKIEMCYISLQHRKFNCFVYLMTNMFKCNYYDLVEIALNLKPCQANNEVKLALFDYLCMNYIKVNHNLVRLVIEYNCLEFLKYLVLNYYECINIKRLIHSCCLHYRESFLSYIFSNYNINYEELKITIKHLYLIRNHEGIGRVKNNVLKGLKYLIHKYIVKCIHADNIEELKSLLNIMNNFRFSNLYIDFCQKKNKINLRDFMLHHNYTQLSDIKCQHKDKRQKIDE